MDEFGNLLLTRLGTTDLPPVMLGSHLDTQLQGGNYDGVYGVMAALEVLEVLDEAQVSTRRPLQLVVWCNEEGVRFPPVTMGSGAYAGTLDQDVVRETADCEGVTVRNAVEACRRELSLDHHQGPRPAAYLEAHIEQGPRLEQDGINIGVVTGIQGLRWCEIVVTGTAGHAGTVPMDVRRDALSAAMTCLQTLQDRADGLLLTVGRVTVSPGTVNTIPGAVGFTLDVRHPDDAVLDAFTADLDALLAAAAPCTASWSLLTRSAAVAFDAGVQATIASSAEFLGLAATSIVSGATHDARNLAGLCPTGMVFIPCKDGISHHPDEHATDEDLVNGTAVLLEAALRMAQ